MRQMRSAGPSNMFISGRCSCLCCSPLPACLEGGDIVLNPELGVLAALTCNELNFKSGHGSNRASRIVQLCSLPNVIADTLLRVHSIMFSWDVHDTHYTALNLFSPGGLRSPGQRRPA